MLTSVYLLNRTETSLLPAGTTPFEIWYDFKPDLKKIKLFGCVSYVHIPEEDRKSKLDERSKKMYMIGYCSNGYRLWDPCKKKVIHARSVIFDENSATELRSRLVEIEQEKEVEEKVNDEEEVTQKEEEQKMDENECRDL